MGDQPDTALIRLLVQARRWWGEFREGTLDVTALAAREQRSPSYIARVVRLAFLSPAVVDAILAGRQGHEVNVGTLTLSDPPPASWRDQAELYLPSIR